MTTNAWDHRIAQIQAARDIAIKTIEVHKIGSSAAIGILRDGILAAWEAEGAVSGGIEMKADAIGDEDDLPF